MGSCAKLHQTAQVCAGSNCSTVFSPNVLVNTCYKNMHMPSNQSQITGDGSAKWRRSSSAASALCLILQLQDHHGFNSMTLHIYVCALIWWVSLCVEIYLTGCMFLFRSISDSPPPPFIFTQHRLCLVLDKEDLIAMFPSSTISKKTITTGWNFPQIEYIIYQNQWHACACACAWVFIFRNNN